jgi:gliding motility-associated-like protein
MKTVYTLVITITLLFFILPVSGQTDTDPPVSPVFNLVSVQPVTGRTELHWSKTPSPDAAGYVLYNFRNNEGFAFDTIHDPDITDYVNMGAFAGDRMESYVIAAIDTAGNISPLSNELHTIFTTAQIDTCNKKIILVWNGYLPVPKTVTGYTILASEDGGPFTTAGSVAPGTTTFSTQIFKTGSQYCFIVRADLTGGAISSSNRVCLKTKMQRPPQWINADQATVNADNTISLSYTIDPLSEIRSFGLDRKKSSDNDFTRLATIQSSAGKVTFTDQTAVSGEKYIYRLGAINNCGNPVVFSPISVNMVLELSAAGGYVILKWNKYREWIGSVDHYKVFLNTGGGFNEKALLQPDDTTFSINYSDIMYEIVSGQYCFRVEAYEGTNPLGISGLSRSNQACSETEEIITVPNAFTPDNDMINDRFRPVLTFTPAEYRLIITDRKNNRLFETTSYQEEWDGTRNGSTLPVDVYLWYLKLKTPSGKSVSRTGTVTIIKNR